MRIVIGLDHAGFALKEDIIAHMEGWATRCSMLDLGPHNTNPVDSGRQG